MSSKLETEDFDPLVSFTYGLKSVESRRQYPRRFKVFLDSLDIKGSLTEQAREFWSVAKENPRWAGFLSQAQQNYLSSPSLTSASRHSFNICRCFSLSCLIVFQTSTSSELFSFFASLMYVSTVVCKKLASVPNAATMLYVELSSLFTIQFIVQQS